MRKQDRSNSSWLIDQMTKSSFFHRKLHEWQLVEIAERIEVLDGAQFNWEDKEQLGIHLDAWNRVIHQGIKPVTVFAHPSVLQTVPRATAYYRMLAMVSQKSMARIGLEVRIFEEGKGFPQEEAALRIARHLNIVISQLVIEDRFLGQRELDLWRGMAAGTQAQGSWQNEKGQQIERLIFERIRAKTRKLNLCVREDTNQILLKNGDMVKFGAEPDIAVYRSDGTIISAVEIKGGIDPAGALERLGAAIKTLQRLKQSNPSCTTILLLRQNSLTKGVEEDLKRSREVIDDWFLIEEIIESSDKEEEFLSRLHLI